MFSQVYIELYSTLLSFNKIMSFGKKCQFIIILLLIGDLSTISMRAGQERLMPE